jgi:hypothetical protein
MDISDINFPRAGGNMVPLIHKFDSSIISGLNAFLVDPDKQRNIVESIPRFPPCTFSSDSKQNSGENCKRQLEGLTDRRYQAGLFTVSEILYDEGRQHAGVSYKFYCGMLCGIDNSVILKKVGGRWIFFQEGSSEIS